MSNLIAEHMALDEKVNHGLDALAKGVRARLTRVNAEIRLARYKEKKNNDWLHLKTQLDVLKTKRRDIDQMLSRVTLLRSNTGLDLGEKDAQREVLVTEFRRT